MIKRGFRDHFLHNLLWHAWYHWTLESPSFLKTHQRTSNFTFYSHTYTLQISIYVSVKNISPRVMLLPPKMADLVTYMPAAIVNNLRKIVVILPLKFRIYNRWGYTFFFFSSFHLHLLWNGNIDLLTMDSYSLSSYYMRACI